MCLHCALYKFTPCSWVFLGNSNSPRIWHSEPNFWTSHVRGVSPYIWLSPAQKQEIKRHWHNSSFSHINLGFTEMKLMAVIHKSISQQNSLSLQPSSTLKWNSHIPTLGCVVRDFRVAEVPVEFCRNLTDLVEAKAPSQGVSWDILSQHLVCPAACLPNFPGARSSQRQEGASGQSLTW